MKNPQKTEVDFFDSLANFFVKLTFIGIGFMVLIGLWAMVSWLLGGANVNVDVPLGVTVMLIFFFSCVAAIAGGIADNRKKKRRLEKAGLRKEPKSVALGKKINTYLDQQLTELEIRDLQEVELKLWAAERKLDFHEKDKTLSKQIYAMFSSIGRMSDNSSHFIVGEEPPGRYLVFRHTSRLLKAETKQEPKPKKAEFTGVGVILEDQTVPSFTLVDKSIVGKVVFKEGVFKQSKLEKLNSKQFPDWLDWREFRCYCPAEEIDLVIKFLEQSGPFRLITHGTSVRLIGFQDDMVCAFFETPLSSDGSNYAKFERFAMRMLELWGRAETLTEKALKAERGED